MKNLKYFKFTVFLILVGFIISCSDDEMDVNQESDLIGTWERSDSSDVFGYTLDFDEDHTGFRTSFTKDLENETFSSSILQFNWSTEDAILNIEGFEAMNTTTRYSIDANGHLYLYDFKESSDPSSLYFIKVE